MSGECAFDSAVNLSSDQKYHINVFRRIYDVTGMAMNERFGKNKKLINALAYLDPRRFDEIKYSSICLNESLKFLADKVNLNYEDLQEELCHFARSYRTIIKSSKALFENVLDYKDDMINELVNS